MTSTKLAYTHAVLPNGGPMILVFGEVKMLWKSEGCHPQQESFLHSGIQKARETNTLAANTLREARSRR